MMKPDMDRYPSSKNQANETIYFLVKIKKEETKLLGVSGNTNEFIGEIDEDSGALYCPLTSKNASILRSRLSWLNPKPLALNTSTGFGDR